MSMLMGKCRHKFQRIDPADEGDSKMAFFLVSLGGLLLFSFLLAARNLA